MGVVDSTVSSDPVEAHGAVPAADHAGPKAKAFLSYSRADVEFAIGLCEELEARGIEVLRDVEDTLPGEEWWRRLQSLIAGADAIVFVLSWHSVESKVCRDEVAYGEELKKRIFPAVIKDVDWASVPPGLAARHSVFFKHEAQRAAGVEQFIKPCSPISTGSASTRGCSSAPRPGSGRAEDAMNYCRAARWERP